MRDIRHPRALHNTYIHMTGGQDVGDRSSGVGGAYLQSTAGADAVAAALKAEGQRPGGGWRRCLYFLGDPPVGLTRPASHRK
jgi:hypothetical protein